MAMHYIVSLSPSVTETVIALDAKEAIVGCTRYCRLDPSVTRVGGLLDADIEAILRLRPESVWLCSMTPLEVEQKLSKLGIPCERFFFDSLQNIETSVARIAKLLEKPQLNVEPLNLSNAQQRSALVVYEPLSLFSAGKETFLSDLLQASGFSSIADRYASSWPRLSFEYVCAANPQKIFVISDLPLKTVIELYKKDSLWKHLPAVQNEAIAMLPLIPCLYPGPNYALLIRQLQKDLLVEPIGIEPTTSSLRTTRSSN